jgi:3-hydroxyisobutyrate dehydrogenase
MCRRLLENQVSVAVWNRTRARAEPLAADGATVTGSITELAELGADLVFITVTGSDDVLGRRRPARAASRRSSPTSASSCGATSTRA